MIALVDDVPANGVSQASVQLILRDANNNALPQIPVQFTSDDNVVLIQPEVTDSAGIALLVATSTVAGPHDIGAKAHDGNGWRTLADTVTLQFADSNQVLPGLTLVWSVADSGPAVADGTSSIALTLSVTQQSGATLMNLPVLVASDDGADSIKPAQGLLSSLGTFTTSISSPRARRKTIVATVGGNKASVEIEFVAGPISQTVSRLQALPTAITGDGVSAAMVTMQAADATGNALPGLPVSFSTESGMSTLDTLQGSTDAAGQVHTQLRSTHSGTAQVTARMADHNYVLVVPVLPRQPSGLFSRIEVPYRAVQADGVSQAPIVVRLADAADKPISGQSVALNSTDPNDVFMPAAGTSDHDGIFSTVLVSQRSGAKSIAATFGRVSVGATATFVPLSADYAHTVWQSSPSQVVADGTTQATLLLLAKDINGNPAVDEPVALSTDSDGALIDTTFGQTDSAGRFSAKVRSSVAGDVVVLATLRKTTVRTTVQFVAGPANAAGSALQLSPNDVLADGTSSASMVARFVDVLGNKPSGRDIVFSAPGGALSHTRLASSTTGTASNSITSTVAQTMFVTATCDGVSVTAPVRFVAGPPSFANSSLAVSPNVGLSDGASALGVVLRVRDKQNNPIANQTVRFSGLASGQTLTPSTGTTNADGIFVASLRASTASTANVRAMVGGMAVSTPVTFVPAGPAAGASSVVASPQQLQADGASAAIIRVTLKDVLGNVVANAPVQFSATGIGHTLSPNVTTTDAQGVATSRVTSTHAELTRVTAAFAGAALGANVTFVAGAPNATHSYFVLGASQQSFAASMPMVPADGVTLMPWRVQLADTFDNPVANQAVQVLGTDSRDTISSMQNVTDANGTMVGTLKSTLANTKMFRAVTDGTTLLAQALFVAGPVAPAPSSLILSAPLSVADGTAFVTATLALEDAHGNPAAGQTVAWSSESRLARSIVDVPADTFSAGTGVTDSQGRLQVQLRSTLAGIKTVSATGAGFVLTGQTRFVAGPASLARSSLTAMTENGLADGSMANVFVLSLLDQYGNAIAAQSVAASSTIASDALSAQDNTTAADGSWTLQLLATVPGTRTVQVQAGGLSLTSSTLLQAGPASALSSMSISPNTLSVDDSARATVRITALDSLGHPSTNQNVTLSASGTGASLQPSQGLTGADGTFVAQLSGNKVGIKAISAAVGNTGDVQLLAPVTFVAGVVSNARSSVVLSSPQGIADGNSPVWLTIVAKDALGNVISGVPVHIASSNMSDTLSMVDGTTNAAGVALSAVRFVGAGLHMFSVQIGATALQTQIVVLPDAASSTTSTLVASPAVAIADNQQTSDILLTAMDAAGNVAANQFVTLTNDGLGSSLTPNEGFTDDQGQLHATLKAARVGTKVVHATVGRALLQVSVTFVAGIANDTGTSLRTNIGSAVADGVQNINITLYSEDAWGNPIAGVPVALYTSGTGNLLGTFSGFTNAAGKLSTTIASTVAQHKTLYAQIGPVLTTATVTFVPGPPSMATSTLVAVPNSISADTSSAGNLRLMARDAQNNAIEGLSVTWGGDHSDAQLQPAEGRTDALGNAAAQFRISRPGTTQLSASIGNPELVRLTANVGVFAGVPSPAYTTLTLSPNSLVADATAAAQLTLRAADAQNNPVANQNVALSPASAGELYAATSGVTDANGVWTTQVRSPLAGTKTATAWVGQASVSATVRFVPGQPDISKSVLSALPGQVIADGLTQSMLAVQLRDAQNNVVPNFSVSFLANGSGNAFSSPSCTTDDSGACSVQLHTTVAQTQTVSARLGSSGAPQLDLSFVAVAGTTSASNTTLSISPSQAVADGQDPLEVRLLAQDAHGNKVVAAPVTLSTRLPSATLAATSGVTDANGLFVTTLRATQAVSQQVTARIGDASVAASATFVAGSIDANNSVLNITQGPLRADGTTLATLRFVAADAFGNPVPAAAVQVAVDGSNNVLAPANLATDALGVAVVTLASTSAEHKNITLTVAGIAPFTAGIDFVAGAAAPLYTTLTASPNTLLADGVATSNVHLLLRDASNNAVTNQAVSLRSSSAQTAVAQGNCITDSAGVCDATISSTRAEPVSIIATTNGLITMVPVVFVPGAADSNFSGLTASLGQVVADGNSQAVVQMVLRDAQQNPLPSTAVALSAAGNDIVFGHTQLQTNGQGFASTTLQSITAGSKTIYAMADGVQYSAVVHFVAGAPSDNTAVLTASPNVVVADGNQSALITLLVKDTFGNLVADQNVAWSSTGGNNVLTTSLSATDAFGIAQVQLQSTTAEHKTVTASIGSLTWTVPLQFVAGAADAGRSLLVAMPAVGIADGNTPVLLSAKLQDAFGNAVDAATVLFNVDGPGAQLSTSQATSDAQGISIVALRATIARAQHVTASIGGAELTTTVPFAAGPPALSSSSIAASTSSAVADGNQTITLTLQALDAFGNPAAGYPVSWSSVPSTAQFSPANGVTDANGRLQTQLRSTHAAAYAVAAQVDGFAVAEQVLFVPGPLDGNSVVFTASPNVLVANGVNAAALTLSVSDAQGNPVAGVDIHFDYSGVAVHVAPATASTDLAGQANASLRGNVAGTQTITAVLRQSGMEVFVPQSVTLVAGQASTAYTSMSAAPSSIVADNANTATVSLVVRDPYNNAVAGQNVVIAAAGSASCTPNNGVTDSNGLFQCTARGTQAEHATFVATYAGHTAQASVDLYAGAADAAHVLLVAPVDRAFADGTAPIACRLSVADAFNNPVSGQSITWSNDGNAINMAQSSGSTDAQGIAFGSATSTLAQQSNIVATLVPSGIRVSAPIQFVPGAAALSGVQLSASPNVVVADGVAQATVVAQVRDRFGNKLVGTAVTLGVDGTANSGMLPSGVTDANGTFATVLRSTRAQAKTLTISVGDVAAVANVLFVAGSPNQVRSSMQAPYFATVADGNNLAPFVVSVLDAYNNIVVGAPVTFATNGNGDTLTTTQALTDVFGNSSTMLSSRSAGSKTVSATLPQFSLSATSDFVSGAVSAQTSSIACLPAIQVADGNSPVACRVIATDAFGNAAGNQTLHIDVTGTGASVAAADGATDGNGLYTTTLTSTVAQSKTITAQFATAAPSTAVQFVAGAANTTLSSFTANPAAAVLADGNSTGNVLLRLRDAYGNPLVGQPVTFSVSGGNNTFVASAAQSDASGIITGTLQSTLAQNKTVTAQIDALQLAVVVPFVPGAVSASVSTLTALPQVVLANGSAQTVLTLTAQDRQKNPIAGQAVVWSSTGGNNTFSTLSSVTDTSGTAVVTLASNKAESKTITATMGAKQVFVAVDFVPGAATAAASSLVASLATAPADDTLQTLLTAVVRDAQQNAIAQQTVTFASSGQNNRFSPSSCVTDSLGSCSVRFASTTAQNKTITASYSGQQLTTAVQMLSGPTSQLTSSFTSDANTVVANGVAQAHLHVLARDAFGNPVANQNVSLSYTGTNITFLAASGATDALGSWMSAVSGTRAQLTTLSATAGSAVLSVPLTFVAGAADAARSSLSIAPPTLVADGASQALVSLILQDAYNNAVGQQAVTLSSTGTANSWLANNGNTDASGRFAGAISSTRAEQKVITAQAGGVSLSGNVVFVTGAASAVRSSFSVQPNSTVANDQNTLALHVSVRDAQDNAIASQGVSFASTGTRNTLSPLTGSTDANGILSATLHSGSAEAKALTATIGTLVLGNNALFVAGAASPSTSSLVVSPNTLVADGGTTTSATAVLLDALGNPIANQAVVWSVSGNNNLATAGASTTNASGRATLQLASSSAQDKVISFAAAGLNLQVPVRFVAGLPSGTTSVLTANGNAPMAADANATWGLQLVVLDASGNRVTGQTIVWSVTGSSNLLSPSTSVSDANGIATSTLSSTLAETKVVRATIGTAAGAPSLTLPVTFVPGPPNSAASSIVVVPSTLTADGVTTSSVTVRSVDAFGNPTPAQALSLSTSGGNNTFAAPNGSSNAAGVYTTTLVSTLAQTQSVTATFAAPGAPSVNTNITFAPGAPSAAQSSLTGSPNVVVANNVATSTVRLRLLDAQRNPVPGFAVSLNANGTGGAWSSSNAGTTDADGVFVGQLRGTVAQAKAVTANFGSASLVVPVTFVAGPPSAVTSTITASPNGLLANGATFATVRLVAIDAFGNLIANLPVALSASGSNNQWTLSGGNTIADGSFTTTLASTVAQQKNITATLGASAAATIQTAVGFVPGPPVQLNSSFVASPNTFVADQVAAAVFTTSLYDAFANPVPDQNVTVGITGSNRVLAPLSGKTSAAGTFSTSVKTTLAQAMTATATVAGFTPMTANVVAVAGPTAYFNVVGLAGGTSAATSAPQVSGFDAYNNPTPAYRGTLEWQSTDASAVLPANYVFTAADAGVHTFPAGVTLVTPGTHTVTARDASNSSVTGSQNNIVINPAISTLASLSLSNKASACLDLQNGDMVNTVAIAGKTCTSARNQIVTLSTDNTLRIQGRCVEVAGGIFVPTTPIQSGTCTAALRQRFTLNATGNLVAVGNPNLCIDLGPADGTQATLATCSAAAVGQVFAPRSASNVYAFVNSSTGQALEVNGGIYSAGRTLQNNTFVNGVHQSFAYSDSNATLSVGGLCVQVAGGVYAPGTGVVLAACDGSAAQKFTLQANAIAAQGNSNYCIDTGASTASTAATLRLCNGSTGQNLAASAAAAAYRYMGRSALPTPLCVNVTGGSLGGSTPLIHAACTPSLAQSFYVNPEAGDRVKFLVNCVDTYPGLLSILGLTSYDNQPLYTNMCGITGAQSWRSTPVAPGMFMMKWLPVGNYCWSAPGVANAPISLMTCNANDANQVFSQLARASVLQATGAPTQCIDVGGNLPVAGAQLQFATCAVSTSQSFVLQTDKSLQYSGLCVDVPAGLSVGSLVKLAPCSAASTTQRWQVSGPAATLPGAAIQSATNSALCFDASAAAAAVAVRLATCTNTAAQTFVVR